MGEEPPARRSRRSAGRERGGRSRRRRALGRKTRRILLAVVALLVVAFLAAGIGFAGSTDEIADGVEIAGVDVGGLTVDEAVQRLQSRTAARQRQPLTLLAGEASLTIQPSELDVDVDWRGAAEQALRVGDGPLPLRGFSRIKLKLSSREIEPTAKAYDAAVDFHLEKLQAKLGDAPRNAAIELNGLQPQIVPGQPGIRIDRARARTLILDALTSSATSRVRIPIGRAEPEVTVEDLQPVAAKVRTMLSAPVRYRLGASSWKITPTRLAPMLVLPRDGSTEIGVGGKAARRYFENLAEGVDRKPQNATFQIVDTGAVEVVPARDGRKLDVAASRKALLAAAQSTTDRSFDLVVRTTEPERTTQAARKMGIIGLVGSYTTTYGGDPNRLSNVRLVAELIDNHLIAPGETFSFNQTTGERNAERGFKEAPVIIDGELQTGLGGGVCQVSTTVFNAAYEAGLKISQRTNHALYIDHYPLGRDATVDYPNIDLKFVNDTSRWIWLKVGIGDSELTVYLYGTPIKRSVETITTPLEVVGKPKIERVPDDSLLIGQKVVEEAGEPPRETSVRRIVRDRNGNVIYDDTWYSSYLAEKRVVRVGTAPRPEPPPPPPAEEPPAEEPAPAEPAPAPEPAPPAETEAPPTDTAGAPGATPAVE